MEGSGARRRNAVRTGRGEWRWRAALTLVCALHGVVLACFLSPAWIGFPHDDTLYLAAGKSLAEGAGAILPSLPGEIAQTKYPPLYPLLISVLWRVGGEIEGVVAAGFWLNWACGALFLAGGFVLMRQLGLNRRPALGLTALAAAHPAIIGLNLLLLSDIPFMALGAWALAAAHWAAEDAGRARASTWGRWGAVAALLSLAVLTRSLGVALIAGVALARFSRHPTAAARDRPMSTALRSVGVLDVRVQYACARLGRAPCIHGPLPRLASPRGEKCGPAGWRRGKRGPALAAAAAAAGVFAAQSWWAWRHMSDPWDHASTGLHQTLTFYTSYGQFWLLCVPDWRTLGAVALFNLREVLKEPAIECFLLPVAGFEGGLLQMVGVAVSVGVMKGAVGLAGEHGWHPAHAALAVYVPLVAVWNYPLAGRFLLLFLPLFLAGAWRELSQLCRGATRLFRRRAPLADRVVCALFMAAIAALPAHAVYRIAWWSPRSLSHAVAQRSAAAAENRRAMDWIRTNTRMGDRFVSYQDARLYLETGRQAIRPMAFRTSALYLQDESILNADLGGMKDVVRGVGARYWVRAEDDFHLEVGEEKIAAAVDRLLAGSPVVFRSAEGRVRIHDIAGWR